MIENIKKITNPLTIVAIFAALAEVAGTVTIGLIDSSIQSIFVWFMIAFPSALIFLFFITLNFNPGVLYSPSDYSDESNFMKAIIKQIKLQDKNKEVEMQIQSLKEEILRFKDLQVIKKQTTELNEMQTNIIRKLDGLSGSVGTVINSAIEYSSKDAEEKLPQSSTQARIMAFLIRNGETSIEELVSETKMPQLHISFALQKMLKREIVKEIEKRLFQKSRFLG